MNLIVADTRELAELALIDVNAWEEPTGVPVFPTGITTCWYKVEDIIELTDGRFGFPTVPTVILEEKNITIGSWLEDFDVIQINNAKHLLPVTEMEESEGF